MRNFWANERPSSTEDGTETSCSLYSASKTGNEEFYQSRHDLSNLSMEPTAQIRGPGLHMGQITNNSIVKIGTISSGSVTIGAVTCGGTTGNEFAQNKRTEHRRQKPEKLKYENDWEEIRKKLHSSEDQINALQIENDQLRQQYQNEKQAKNDLEKDLINCQSRLKKLENENRRLEAENQNDKDIKSFYQSDIQQTMLKLRSFEERYNTFIKSE